MKSRISKAIFIGLAAAGLASCSQQASVVPGPVSPAPASPLIVEITVTGSVDSAVTIKVDPYLLDLAGHPGQQPLKFKLISTNFSYVADKNEAIEIKNNGGQFFGNNRGPQGKMMTVTDKNNNDETYQYILRIEDSLGNKLELDPLIKNGE